MTITWAGAPTDLGHLLVARTERGCCVVRLDDDPATGEQQLQAWADRTHPGAAVRRDDPALADVLAAATARIAGDPAAPQVDLDLVGTDFQRAVWDALTTIPFGAVRTYGQVAAAIGAPRAVRAVGSACGANPVALIVPCHRVVPAGGGIGNYGLGPDRKRMLLEREAAPFSAGSTCRPSGAAPAAPG